MIGADVYSFLFFWRGGGGTFHILHLDPSIPAILPELNMLNAIS